MDASMCALTTTRTSTDNQKKIRPRQKLFFPRLATNSTKSLRNSNCKPNSNRVIGYLIRTANYVHHYHVAIMSSVIDSDDTSVSISCHWSYLYMIKCMLN